MPGKILELFIDDECPREEDARGARNASALQRLWLAPSAPRAMSPITKGPYIIRRAEIAVSGIADRPTTSGQSFRSEVGACVPKMKSLV
jgi:hypothetical protein